MAPKKNFNRPLSKPNQFWTWPGYIIMLNCRPFLPCIPKKMPPKNAPVKVAPTRGKSTDRDQNLFWRWSGSISRQNARSFIWNTYYEISRDGRADTHKQYNVFSAERRRHRNSCRYLTGHVAITMPYKLGYIFATGCRMSHVLSKSLVLRSPSNVCHLGGGNKSVICYLVHVKFKREKYSPWYKKRKLRSQ